MIHLETIDRFNYIDVIKLSVQKEQEDFISSNLFSLAQAKAQPECVPLGIYNESTLIGFVMYCIDHDDHEYWIYRFMIDKQYQHHGYGLTALDIIIQKIATDKKHHKIYLSFEPENIVAKQLYEKVGFVPDGRILDEEIVYLLELNNYFDSVAKSWDNDRRIERAKTLSSYIKTFLESVNATTVLDFGCGTGLLTFNLFPYVANIYGYDPSSEMCHIFKNKINQYHTSNVHILSDFNTTKFDLIFSSMVFHHIDDTTAQILHLKQNLTSNGNLIIIDLDEDDGSFHENEPNFHGHNGFNRTDLQTQLLNCGFSSVKFKTVYKDTKQIGNRNIPYSLFMAIAS